MLSKDAVSSILTKTGVSVITQTMKQNPGRNFHEQQSEAYKLPQAATGIGEVKCFYLKE